MKARKKRWLWKDHLDELKECIESGMDYSEIAEKFGKTVATTRRVKGIYFPDLKVTRLKLKPKVCPICLETYTPYKKNQQICKKKDCKNERCRLHYYKVRKREWSPDANGMVIYSAKCPWCRKEHTSKRAGHWIYCGDCQKKVDDSYTPNGGTVAAGWHSY